MQSWRIFPFYPTFIFSRFLFILPYRFYFNPFGFYHLSFHVHRGDLKLFFYQFPCLFISLSQLTHLLPFLLKKLISFAFPFEIPGSSKPPSSIIYSPHFLYSLTSYFPLVSFSAFPYMFSISRIFSSDLSLPWHCLAMIVYEPPKTANDSLKSGPSTSSRPFIYHGAYASQSDGSIPISANPVAWAGIATLRSSFDYLKQFIIKKNKS